MTDLAALIAALKAGDVDTVLAGTKYADKTIKRYEDVDVESRSYTIQEVELGEQSLHKDAKANAARVVVLEAALCEMHRHLGGRVANQLESHEHFGDNPPSYLLAEKRDLDATADLLVGGE